MPAPTGGELANIRDSHYADMYVAVLVPADIITARVDGDHTRGDETIACDTISGTQANVKSEMLVWFGSTAGAYDLGRYMAKSMAAGTLTIEENDLDLDGNEYVTVKELWVPRSKLPSIDVSGADVVFSKWGDTYTDQNTNTPPVVCMGPPECQFIDEGDGYATVKFVDEYSWSPVGASLDTVTWDYDGGAEQSGAGTAADPYIVRYDTAGTYWVSLTITDDNAVTSVSWRPVFIFDSDNMPYDNWTSEGRRLSLRENSQHLTIFGDADESEFPPGTWVVRFNRDYYGGSEAVIENTYPFRGHIKFFGFIREGSIETNTEVFSVDFEVIDLAIIMGELPAFGDVISDVASPSSWVEMANPTVIRAVTHVLMWQSNILTIADLIFDLERTDPGELYIAAQRWGKGSLLDQVNLPLLHSGVYAQCAVNKQGCLNVRQDPLLVDHAARDAYVDTVCHLTAADYSELSFTNKYNTVVQYVRFSGIAYDGSTATPLGSRAPGVPDQAVDVHDVGSQILVSQADTNRLSGDLKAKLENDVISAKMILPGPWDIFDPSLQERITFDLDPTENNLGLDYDSTTDWIVREVDIQEDPVSGVVRQVALGLEKETFGVDGVTIVIGEAPVWPEPAQPDPEPDKLGPDVVLTELIVGSREAGVAFCEVTDFAAGAPTWQLLNEGLVVPGAHYIHDLKIQDLGNNQFYIYAATNCGIWRRKLPTTADTIWEYRLTTAAIHAATGYSGIAHVQHIIFDWSLAGHAWARVTVATWSPHRNFVIETWDSFATCTVTGAATGVGYEGQGDMAVNRHNTSILLAHGQSGGTGALVKSINGGGTWAVADAGQPWQLGRGCWGYSDSSKYAWWQKTNVSPVWYSDDFTASWATAAYDGTEVRHIRANDYDRRSAFLVSFDGVCIWDSVGEEFDLFDRIVTMLCQDAVCISRAADQYTALAFAVVGGQTNQAEAWYTDGTDLLDRTGNLDTILQTELEGTATDIDCIAIPDWYGGLL